jgi:two-component system KDP operon response regulator KdpE
MTAMSHSIAPQPQGGRRTAIAILSNRFDLREALEEDFEVATFSFRRMDEIRQHAADVILIDARSEHHHDLVADLARRSRRQVVVIGPPDESAQAMRYLDLGASDFFSSRTAPIERSARLRAAARRADDVSNEDDFDLVIGPVAISLRRHEVLKDGEPVRLTPNEYRVLEVLAERPDETISHRDLIARVWGPEYLSARHYLRIYIRQLREKLEVDPALPTLLKTEWGSGYTLSTTGAGPAAARRPLESA